VDGLRIASTNDDVLRRLYCQHPELLLPYDWTTLAGNRSSKPAKRRGVRGEGGFGIEPYIG